MEVHEAKLREARRKETSQLTRISELLDTNSTLGTCTHLSITAILSRPLARRDLPYSTQSCAEYEGRCAADGVMDRCEDMTPSPSNSTRLTPLINLCTPESEVVSLREGKLSLEGRVKALKASLDKEQRATTATSARIQEVTPSTMA